MSSTVKLFFIALFLLVLDGGLIWKGRVAHQKIVSSPANLGESFRVVRVIDGDTFAIDYHGQEEKVRYIGVNTPETVDLRRPVQCFGKEASDEDKKLLENQEVYLEKDVSETDKYGRLLRYVYLKLADGSTLFVNDYLARSGFAQIDTVSPDVKYQARFLEAEKEARNKNLGLWSSCGNLKTR